MSAALWITIILTADTANSTNNTFSPDRSYRTDSTANTADTAVVLATVTERPALSVLTNNNKIKDTEAKQKVTITEYLNFLICSSTSLIASFIPPLPFLTMTGHILDSMKQEATGTHDLR